VKERPGKAGKKVFEGNTEPKETGKNSTNRVGNGRGKKKLRKQRGGQRKNSCNGTRQGSEKKGGPK